MGRPGLTGAVLLLVLLAGPAAAVSPEARAATELSRPESLVAVLTQLDAAHAAGNARVYLPLRVLWTDTERPVSGRVRLWLRGLAGDPLQAARLSLRGWLLLAYTAALFAGWYYLLLLLLYAGRFRHAGARFPAWLALPFFAPLLLWRYAAPAERRLCRTMLGLVPVGLMALGALPAMLAARAPELIAFAGTGRGSVLELWLSSWSPAVLLPGLSPFAWWRYGWPLLLAWCGVNALGIWLAGGNLLTAAAAPGRRARRASTPEQWLDEDGRVPVRLVVLARLLPGFAAALTGRLAAGARLALLSALTMALALLPAPWWQALLAGETGRRSLLAALLTGYAIMALAVECWRAPDRLRPRRRKAEAAAATPAER